MPSRAEGLGSAALVAMAQGVPVVASRVGGLPEVVEEGETGWLVPPGSPQALADAITHAASDPERLREMGNKARQRALQFSSTLMVELTEALYLRLAR
jgi:glycosyltransferase involved in cell wall biosynthesis